MEEVEDIGCEGGSMVGNSAPPRLSDPAARALSEIQKWCSPVLYVAL